MKQFLLSLFVLSFPCALSAQTISGVIVDAETAMPVAYASIGIEGTSIGTVADENGNYALKLRPERIADTVRFSHIGYEPVKVAVEELITMPSADAALQPAVFQIEDVVIVPAKWRRRTLGKDFASSSFNSGNAENSLGFEVGPLFKFNKRARLETIQITVRNCTFERLIFRINIYRQTPDGRDFVNILTKPIYSHIDKTRYSKSGMTTVVVDVSGHNIVTEGNTLVTFEYIESGSSEQVTFPVGFIGNECYSRRADTGVWEKEILKFPIKVTALVEK